MPSHTLKLELLGVYMTDMPGFDIWKDGVSGGSNFVTFAQINGLTGLD